MHNMVAPRSVAQLLCALLRGVGASRPLPGVVRTTDLLTSALELRMWPVALGTEAGVPAG